jgi:CDP-glucose 4,6-dehydratase
MVRDYIYTGDVVHGYLLLAERMERLEIHGEAFNLSTGIQVTVVAMVERILRLMDREGLVPRILNEASNEIQRQYLSSEKARKVLGWLPAFTLDDGLRETIGWYREFFLATGVVPDRSPS